MQMDDVLKELNGPEENFVQYVEKLRDFLSEAERNDVDVLRAHLKKIAHAAAADSSDNGKKDTGRKVATACKFIKAMLGLGIIVAEERDIEREKQMLDEDLLAMLSNEKDYSLWHRRLIFNELTYADQYLACSQSDLANLEENVEHIKQNVTSLERAIHDNEGRIYLYGHLIDLCDKDKWSAGICDYSINIEQWIERLKYTSDPEELKRPSKKDGGLDIYAICSVKGGVGKTTTAIALFDHFTRTCKEKTLIIDLDFHGPTIQYHMDIRDCCKGLSPIPDQSEKEVKSEKTEWVYPTLLDLLDILPTCSSGDEEEEQELVTKAKQTMLPVFGSDGLGAAVLLPDSPSYARQFGIDFDSKNSHEYVTKVLLIVLEAASQEGYRNIILDMSPGLTGGNAPLLRKSSLNFSTQMVLLGS
jgi:hypothetical protein